MRFIEALADDLSPISIAPAHSHLVPDSGERYAALSSFDIDNAEPRPIESSDSAWLRVFMSR